MSINYTQKRDRADLQIRKFGQQAKLRRASGDRSCWTVEVELRASEKQALKNFTSRIFLISAVDLDVPPAKDDALILFDQADGTTELPPLRQVAPVDPFAPGGVTIYYELQVE